MSPPDDLSAPADVPGDVAAALSLAVGRLGRLGTSLIYFQTVGSTNDVAVRLAAMGGHEGAVVLAEQQTAGRGRRGRAWFSPLGSGLYVSVVLEPGRAIDDAERATSLLTMTAGLALAEAIETSTGLRADIKWPNDLVAGRRKLAGILAEAVSGAPRAVMSVVLGYGVNVRPAAYPAELHHVATSLESELGRGVDRADLFVETLAALNARYDDLLSGRFDAILDAWRLRAPRHRGARVEWDAPTGPRSGVTAGVDRDGALLVRAGQVVERIVSGEVRWECF